MLPLVVTTLVAVTVAAMTSSSACRLAGCAAFESYRRTCRTLHSLPLLMHIAVLGAIWYWIVHSEAHAALGIGPIRLGLLIGLIDIGGVVDDYVEAWRRKLARGENTNPQAIPLPPVRFYRVAPDYVISTIRASYK